MPFGHEVIVYGYSKPLNRYYIANSWGTGWGADGLCSAPFSALDVFKAKGGYDAQYLTFKAPPSPVPVNNPGCNPLGVFF